MRTLTLSVVLLLLAAACGDDASTGTTQPMAPNSERLERPDVDTEEVLAEARMQHCLEPWQEDAVFDSWVEAGNPREFANTAGWVASDPEEFEAACDLFIQRHSVPDSMVRHAREEAEAEVMRRVIQEDGPNAESRIRELLTDQEVVYCFADSAVFTRVASAASALGLVSTEDATDPVYIGYWAVRRPDEFVRACSAAFGAR